MQDSIFKLQSLQNNIKELIKKYKYEIKKYHISEYNTSKTIEIGMLTLVITNLKKLITYLHEDLKEFTKDILQTHENEIAEKNEYIKFLENRRGNHDCNNCPNNKQQLFKEDFIIEENHNGLVEIYEGDNKFFTDDIKYVLKDNLKYDTLPRKVVK